MAETPSFFRPGRKCRPKRRYSRRAYFCPSVSASRKYRRIPGDVPRRIISIFSKRARRPSNVLFRFGVVNRTNPNKTDRFFFCPAAENRQHFRLSASRQITAPFPSERPEISIRGKQKEYRQFGTIVVLWSRNGDEKDRRRDNITDFRSRSLTRTSVKKTSCRTTGPDRVITGAIRCYSLIFDVFPYSTST